MYKQPYTNEQILFIQDNCSKMTITELVALFNQTFNDNRTKKGLQYYIQSRGWRAFKRPNTWADGFTPAQKDFMKHYAPQMSRKELTKRLNEVFGTSISINTIKGWCARNKLTSPNGNGRFTSETSPRWQSGLSKEEFKSHYSDESFKNMINPMIKSNIQYHIGDEIIRHGIPYIIINDDFGYGIDNRIKRKSIYVWESNFGTIPDDYMIIHLDNDNMNCDISNLRCIPQSYRAFFRHNNWWSASPEIKEVAIAWCNLFYILKQSEMR